MNYDRGSLLGLTARRGPGSPRGGTTPPLRPGRKGGAYRQGNLRGPARPAQTKAAPLLPAARSAPAARCWTSLLSGLS